MNRKVWTGFIWFGRRRWRAEVDGPVIERYVSATGECFD